METQVGPGLFRSWSVGVHCQQIKSYHVWYVKSICMYVLICKECKSLQIQSFSWRLLKLCLVSVLLEVSAHEQEYSLDLLYTESVMRCYDGIFVTDIGIRWPVAEEDTPVNKQVYLKLALFSLRRLYSLTCLTKLWAPFFGLLHINSSSCWLFHVCLPPELQC